MSIFVWGEEERCALWVEAGEAGVSAAGRRGLSAMVSIVRELMGMSDEVSGRERTIRESMIKEVNLVKVQKEERKAGTIQ